MCLKFVDAEIAAGRAVILEIGTESTLVRAGKEIAEFIKRLFGRGKPTLTSLTPMAGGEMTEPPPPVAELFQRRYDGPAVAEQPRVPGYSPSYRRAVPEAEFRAWNALVEKIGESAARGLLTGGGYAIRSTLWPSVLYVVTPDIIKVVYYGMQVGRICIVATDGAPIWDVILNRIQLLQAGADGEIQVFATGELQRP